MENNTKKKRGCLMPVIIILIIIAVGVSILVKVTTSDKDTATTAPPQPAYIEAEQFSKISESQLIDLLGEPTEKEDWTNKVSDTLGYEMTTYHYTVDDVCNEYNFCKNDAGEKLLVYMGIKFNYAGKGSNLGVGLNKDIFAQIGVTPSSSMKKEADTGVAIRWSSVSDKVYEVWAVTNGKDNKMVDWLKIKFDPNFPL